MLAVVLSGPAAQAQVSLSAFGELPGISNIELSPSGSKFAAIQGD